MATIRQFVPGTGVRPLVLFEEAVAACLATYIPEGDEAVDARVVVSGGRVVVEGARSDLQMLREACQGCTLLKMFSIPWEVMEWR